MNNHKPRMNLLLTKEQAEAAKVEIERLAEEALNAAARNARIAATKAKINRLADDAISAIAIDDKSIFKGSIIGT